MKGFACACPSCGAPERVSLFVLDSPALRFSHRCATCGKASTLAAWSDHPRPAKRRGSRVGAA
jgi:uncharacterized protein (DUF983 family)